VVGAAGRGPGVVAIALAGIAAALLLAAAAAPAAAEETPAQKAAPEGWAYDLANELMSPYCPGRTLADCPSPQAQTLRMWLIVQESAGRSREEVKQELVQRFGDQILGAPRPKGFGLATYVLPVLAFLGGGALVASLLVRLTRRGPSAPPAGAEARSERLDPELERLVDEELSG
jgi:cytochrome c-type biogenesis protein CcmH